MVGERDESKWKNNKPIVLWVQIRKEDIGKYTIRNKINAKFHGPVSAILPATIIPDSIKIVDQIGSLEKAALVNELKQIDAPAFFIKDMSLHKETQTLQVDLYNFEGQRLKFISLKTTMGVNGT
ncbi:hypothetical protein [Paenibacillus xerothermodurans]|uniref:Uncharacterized protein n=1 Tax=Paenibacillus xerothermodurans TaxID=1977292 RepID=A0A2W1NJC2_PAEXE|nr:hypothetical protein [Paenibacillus xerothermodurans]PZE19625.1 hypothetical protein CBW46_016895 [Paenibacillus xerothermodurans]